MKVLSDYEFPNASTLWCYVCAFRASESYAIQLSVIESPLQEIIGTKNLALKNLSWNFSEEIMNADKVIPEIWLLSVNFEKFLPI